MASENQKDRIVRRSLEQGSSQSQLDGGQPLTRWQGYTSGNQALVCTDNGSQITGFVSGSGAVPEGSPVLFLGQPNTGVIVKPNSKRLEGYRFNDDVPEGFVLWLCRTPSSELKAFFAYGVDRSPAALFDQSIELPDYAGIVLGFLYFDGRNTYALLAKSTDSFLFCRPAKPPVQTQSSLTFSLSGSTSRVHNSNGFIHSFGVFSYSSPYSLISFLAVDYQSGELKSTEANLVFENSAGVEPDLNNPIPPGESAFTYEVTDVWASSPSSPCQRYSLGTFPFSSYTRPVVVSSVETFQSGTSTWRLFIHGTASNGARIEKFITSLGSDIVAGTDPQGSPIYEEGPFQLCNLEVVYEDGSGTANAPSPPAEPRYVILGFWLDWDNKSCEFFDIEDDPIESNHPVVTSSDTIQGSPGQEGVYTSEFRVHYISLAGAPSVRVIHSIDAADNDWGPIQLCNIGIVYEPEESGDPPPSNPERKTYTLSRASGTLYASYPKEVDWSFLARREASSVYEEKTVDPFPLSGGTYQYFFYAHVPLGSNSVSTGLPYPHDAEPLITSMFSGTSPNTSEKVILPYPSDAPPGRRVISQTSSVQAAGAIFNGPEWAAVGGHTWQYATINRPAQYSGINLERVLAKSIIVYYTTAVWPNIPVAPVGQTLQWVNTDPNNPQIDTRVTPALELVVASSTFSNEPTPGYEILNKVTIESNFDFHIPIAERIGASIYARLSGSRKETTENGGHPNRNKETVSNESLAYSFVLDSEDGIFEVVKQHAHHLPIPDLDPEVAVGDVISFSYPNEVQILTPVSPLEAIEANSDPGLNNPPYDPAYLAWLSGIASGGRIYGQARISGTTDYLLFSGQLSFNYSLNPEPLSNFSHLKPVSVSSITLTVESIDGRVSREIFQLKPGRTSSVDVYPSSVVLDTGTVYNLNVHESGSDTIENMLFEGRPNPFTETGVNEDGLSDCLPELAKKFNWQGDQIIVGPTVGRNSTEYDRFISTQSIPQAKDEGVYCSGHIVFRVEPIAPESQTYGIFFEKFIVLPSVIESTDIIETCYDCITTVFKEQV